MGKESADKDEEKPADLTGQGYHIWFDIRYAINTISVVLPASVVTIWQETVMGTRLEFRGGCASCLLDEANVAMLAAGFLTYLIWFHVDSLTSIRLGRAVCTSWGEVVWWLQKDHSLLRCSQSPFQFAVVYMLSSTHWHDCWCIIDMRGHCFRRCWCRPNAFDDNWTQVNSLLSVCASAACKLTPMGSVVAGCVQCLRTLTEFWAGSVHRCYVGVAPNHWLTF